MAVETRIQLRRDTATNWSTTNPVLAAGEIGYITTGTGAGNAKIGDGTTAWNSLSFIKSGTAAKILASSVERTVYVQSTQPTGVSGDIWIQTA
jgi:hypothetical protein